MRRRTSRRPGARLNRAVAVLAAATVALAATGCTGGGRSTEAVALDQRHPAALFLGEQLGLIDYAQLKVRNQCMAEAGYPQLSNVMLPRATNPFAHLELGAGTFGATSEEQARRTGFGRDEPAQPAVVVSFDPSYDKMFETCSARAWERLGKDAEKLYLGYFDLGNSIAAPLVPLLRQRADPDGATRLLDCLGGKGYLASDPQAFRKEPDARLFGVPFGDTTPRPEDSWQPTRTPGTVAVGPAVPAREYRASAQEGALAVAWFQCAQDTGYADQQLTLALKIQAELVAKQEDTFAELNPRVEQVAREAAALIGQR